MAAAIIAAVLVLGGAYFVGYVSELQRDLQDPASSRTRSAAQTASIEKTLGYEGFLKAYRNYRLTGDANLRHQLNRSAIEAARALEALQAQYKDNPAAADALREIGAITETFAHIARTAPEMGPTALRGTAAMDALNTLPQSPQLEATYVALRGALDRLRQSELDRQLGGAASALTWGQALLIATIGSLVLGLLVVAGLLQLGIIQPLKSLERSLASVGDGAVSQKIWGVERTDEFGAIARAGEKVRRGLLETTALKSLAEKGQIHLSLDGQSSILFERLSSDIVSASQSLKVAAGDLLRLQDDNRRQFDEAVQKLSQSGAGVDGVVKSLRDGADAVIGDMRASAVKMAEDAAGRIERWSEIADRFDQGSRKLEETAANAHDKATAAIGDLDASTTSLKRIAVDAQLIQGAFFTACDKISSDASNTTENVRTLAARLNEAVGSVDERLSQKLSALDQLEHGLSETLSKLQSRTDETIAAMNNAAASLDQSNAAADERIKQSTAEVEELLRLFRDDGTVTQRASDETIAQLQAAQQTLADAAATRADESRQLADAIARLNEIAAELQRPQPAPEPIRVEVPVPVPVEPAVPSASAAELQSLADVLRQQSDNIRTEIRDLAVRLTEDRLLASAEMPFATVKGGKEIERQPSRTLADVSGEEIMTRLKSLAAEMTAAQGQLDQVSSLRSALGSFASDVKKLAAGADRAARLKSMGKALDRHADEIEARAQAIEPGAETLRGELHSITSELRTIAARAQSTGVKEGPALREAAIELGARAETVFASLNETQQDGTDAGEEDLAAALIEPASTAQGDLAALSQLIDRLEARAEHLSQSSIADRLADIDDIDDTLSPAERQTTGRATAHATDSAIHTVFESIERLNNIAAALARAGDMERQRRAAH